jgi:hypothetical protein
MSSRCPAPCQGSDTVPSALSAKNAADDKLPIVAYTFKGLIDDQRRAIYQIVTGKALNAVPPNAATAAEVGTELPSSVALSVIPDKVTAQIPQAGGYDYAMAADKLLFVSPVKPRRGGCRRAVTGGASVGWAKAPMGLQYRPCLNGRDETVKLDYQETAP